MLPTNLGLDPATRDALFRGVGSRWVEDLGHPEHAVPAALGRAIAGHRGTAIRGGSPPTSRRPEVCPAGRAPGEPPRAVQPQPSR